MDTHFIMANLENAAAYPGASVSAFRPLEATLHTTATRILSPSEKFPVAPMTIPTVTRSFSESQILILIILQASSSFVPRASLSHLLHCPASQPSRPQPLWSCCCYCC